MKTNLVSSANFYIRASNIKFLLYKLLAITFLLSASACVPAENLPSPDASNTMQPEVNSRPQNQSEFYFPEVCRKVYVRAPSKDFVLSELKRIADRHGWDGIPTAVYLTKQGDYIGAETLYWYLKNPSKYLKDHTLKKSDYFMQRALRDGDYTPTAYCSDGSEIQSETGIFYERKLNNDTGGIVLQAASGLTNMVRDGASSTPSTGVYTLKCSRGAGVWTDDNARGPSLTCTDTAVNCQSQLNQMLENQYGGQTNACTSILGSGWSANGIDQSF